MSRPKKIAVRLHAALLGLVLWIPFYTGSLQDKWEGFPALGSEAFAQDLSGSFLTLTQKCKWKDTGVQCKISGKFKILNLGEEKAPSSKVRFFLSDDSVLDEDNDLSLKEVKVGSISAGKSKTKSVKINLSPGISASDKIVIALVDADNSVPETDETNNVIISDMFPSGTQFFPFEQGNIWEFQGTISGNTESPSSYVNTRMVTGNKELNGVTTTVFTESNSDNSGIAIDEYLVKDDQGITFWGGSGDAGIFPSQMIPFHRVYFPLQLKTPVKESFKGLDLGEDIDGDGMNETTDVNTTVTVAAFEGVVVPAGTFSNSVRINTEAKLSIMLSVSHKKVKFNVTQAEWFADGLGPVKRNISISARIQGQKFSEQVIEELNGAISGGEGTGIVHIPIADGVATADSDTTNPGKTAIGFDGTNYLVAFYSETEPASGLNGAIISGNGSILNTFLISPNGEGCSTWPCKSTNPAIAFDGANYLVVFVRDGNIYGMRVSPSGVLLDDEPGFQISSGTINWLPAIAFDGNDFMVVWNKYYESQNGIYAAKVTPEGVLINEFPISFSSGEQINPSIAFDGSNYFLVYRDTKSGSGLTEDADIYGARVTPEGNVLDPEGIPVSTAPGYQDGPQIIFDGASYFVVWTDARNDPDAQFPPCSDIFGARINPDGMLLDGPSDTGGIAINTYSSPKWNPRVSFDGEHFFVIWEYSYSYDEPVGIFGAKVSADGNLVNGPSDQIGLPISGPPLSSTGRFVHPDILFGGNAYLIDWVNNSEAIGTMKDIQGALLFP
ncbi:hypothetical protein PITCH_A1630009 [uncultured Desulfobacterium sp.]|uniref:CARDB domain-containing protein n=1 Tax=uncultured Desulfobacterium sp. TaxID=201089 RepID=A0A445MU22_9BACT|nr:hypothetical protein PITCH_A1630009 [uncultured Desulfobacterium sp.]